MKRGKTLKLVKDSAVPARVSRPRIQCDGTTPHKTTCAYCNARSQEFHISADEVRAKLEDVALMIDVALGMGDELNDLRAAILRSCQSVLTSANDELQLGILQETADPDKETVKAFGRPPGWSRFYSEEEEAPVAEVQS